MYVQRAIARSVSGRQAQMHFGKIAYSNYEPQARAVVSKMEVISVLDTVKLHTHCLLEQHLNP